MALRRQNNVGGDFPNLRYAPAVAAFDPLTLITGAGGFWRADMGVTGSPNVTAWADQSSFANTLTMQYLARPNDGTNATFSATGFNASKPGITFVTDAGVCLATGISNIFSATSTASIFMLIEFTAAPPNFPDSRMVSLYSGTATNIYTTPGFLLGSDTNALQFYSSGELGNGGSNVAATSATPYLFGGVFDGAHANKWLNGAAQGAGTVFASNVGDTTVQFFVGAPTNNGFCAPFTVAFWGITKKAMNSTDWGNLKTWSNTNWGTSF